MVNHAVDHDDRLILFDEEAPRLMFYLPDHLLYYAETKPEMRLMDATLHGSPEVDVLLQTGELRRLKKLAGRPLFVEGSERYRRERFHVLTTEAKPHLPRFDDTHIAARLAEENR